MDFIEARQQRREILAYIKRQQAEDSSCISQVKAVAVDGKRELLGALANWLAAIDIVTPITDRTREAFADVTTRASIDNWVELKRKQVTLRARLEVAKTLLQEAENAYDEAAPFGFLSTAFADDAKKSVIQSLKSKRDNASAARDAAEVDFGRNEQALSVVCEFFLTDSQISDHLRVICERPELGVFAVPILERTKQRATELWQAHARKHAIHCSDMEVAARGLRSFYEKSSSSLPKCLPAGDSER
jgi:hypothetical protein